MLCDIMVIETVPNGDSFFTDIPLQGEARAIAHEIAALTGDLQAQCIEGNLLAFTITTAFLDINGKVYLP